VFAVLAVNYIDRPTTTILAGAAGLISFSPAL
jgi:hypothetical protein